MSAKDSQNITRIFRALSVESRVEIIRLLAERTLCVGALSNLLKLSAGAVSQHLRVLKDADLVEADRRGCFIHYRLTEDAKAQCRSIVDTLFGAKEGGKQCVAGKQSAKGRKT